MPVPPLRHNTSADPDCARMTSFIIVGSSGTIDCEVISWPLSVIRFAIWRPLTSVAFVRVSLTVISANRNMAGALDS